MVLWGKASVCGYLNLSSSFSSRRHAMFFFSWDLASAVDPGWPLAEWKRGCHLPPGGKAGGSFHLNKEIICLRQSKVGGAGGVQHPEEGGGCRGVGAAVFGGGRGGQLQICFRKWPRVNPNHLKKRVGKPFFFQTASYVRKSLPLPDIIQLPLFVLNGEWGYKLTCRSVLARFVQESPSEKWVRGRNQE